MTQGQHQVQKTFFLDLVRSRRSIRRFLPRPVEREKILTCLEAARLAPSANNVQPWRFLVIDQPELKEKFSAKAFSGIYSLTRFAAQAPVLILVLARLDLLANRIGKQIQGVAFYLIDIGIAGEHIVLQAEELGLGTCWIGWFNYRQARKVLRVPKKYKIVCLLAMGYYEKKPERPRTRRALEDIAWFNEIKS